LLVEFQKAVSTFSCSENDQSRIVIAHETSSFHEKSTKLLFPEISAKSDILFSDRQRHSHLCLLQWTSTI